MYVDITTYKADFYFVSSSTEARNLIEFRCLYNILAVKQYFPILKTTLDKRRHISKSVPS